MFMFIIFCCICDKDVMRLKSQLPKLMDVVPVDSPRCNHVDFLWSLDVTKRVNVNVTDILQKTDHADWEYTGPPASLCSATGCGMGENDAPRTKGRQPNSTNDHHEFSNFAPAPENSSGATPVDDESAEVARERRLQLFDNLIVLLKSTETEYHRLRDGLTRELSEWSNRGARNQAGKCGHSTGNNSVAVAGPEATVVGCAAVKSKQSIITMTCRTGIGKVVDFVDYCGGLNHMDDRTAAERTLHTTFSSLGRAIRFLRLRYK